MRTRNEVTTELINWFADHENVFNMVIEDLDDYNGFLGDNRYYEMDYLDKLFYDTEPTRLLNMAFFGHDEETSNENYHTEFNPNRKYFTFNGYGNLVSADVKDYSCFLDHWFIDVCFENSAHLWTITESGEDEMTALFAELQQISEAETEEA